jgi:hypothetical protein
MSMRINMHMPMNIMRLKMNMSTGMLTDMDMRTATGMLME